MVYKISDKKLSVFADKYRAADTDCLIPQPGGLLTPHSADFLDLDGICMPDLSLTKTDPSISNSLLNLHSEDERGQLKILPCSNSKIRWSLNPIS